MYNLRLCESRDKLVASALEIERKVLSERIAVHAVPIGVGGEAEGAVAGCPAAATEKTAGVAGDLVAGDGDVLENALLHGVVVRIEGCDGELREHVLLSVRQGGSGCEACWLQV